MPGKITYLKLEEFVRQATFSQCATECKINELAFRKGDTLKDHNIKQVLDICNKYSGFNINTLIIKENDELTIWIAEKSQDVTSSEPPAQPEENQPELQSLPTKTLTKRYRGQVYEETVVDWTAIQQLNQSKPRRKYRGQYIE